MNKKDGVADIWIFVFCVLAISCFMSWRYANTQMSLWVNAAPFTAGLLAFVFQLVAGRRPLIELYSRGYPYRKLKLYGVFSAFILFEFLLAWGLYTKKIYTGGEDTLLIAVVFLGVVVYYHAFVRMKISLRFLFLAIFVPLIAAGTTLGLGSYFKILKLVLPQEQIGNIVILNTAYWILFYIFTQMVCEEPAFRGYLMQRLLYKGETFAVIVSSFVFAVWRIPFMLLSGMNYAYMLLVLGGNLVMGAIFALLFIKGRNLLVAVLCHGIIGGLRNSIFASVEHPGIKAYFEFLTPQGSTNLMALWFGSLLIGLILITFIPRKKIHLR